MKKITNLIISPTKYTEDVEWVGPISIKYRLLESTDWIVQIGSGVVKQHKWLKWRESVRKCTRNSFETPQQMNVRLDELDSSKPELRRYTSIDNSNIIHYKDNIIKLVRYYHSKKLDIEISSYLNNYLLLDERYKEAEKYSRTKDLTDCFFIKSYMDVTGENVEDVVQYFLKQKEMYFLILLRNQKEMELKLKEIDDSDDIEFLFKLHEDYNTWISTLTLTPVQI